MACRNVELANKSRDELLSRFKDAHIHVEQLDVSDNKSIHNFVQTVADKYKTIDVLINNAGVARKGDEFNEEVATWTFATVVYLLSLEFLWYDQFY
jgi:NADP-dependent 3-hydroxy acid dehydrogenase YdfG